MVGQKTTVLKINNVSLGRAPQPPTTNHEIGQSSSSAGQNQGHCTMANTPVLLSEGPSSQAGSTADALAHDAFGNLCR